MARLKSYILGGTTIACALGIGYVMQYGLALPGAQAQAPVGGYTVTDIKETSSSNRLPAMPTDTAMSSALPLVPVAVASVDAGLTQELPQDDGATGFACDITMTATPTAGALVNIDLKAPCNASERLTVHHQGMMFTEVTQPDGRMQITVPALAERATFIAAFASGSGTTAFTEVTSLPFYDRVVVQWKGQAGLQLHAREYGADYFQPGHIWASETGDLTAAAMGQGGYLVRLGLENAPDALMAEVYSFPTGTAKRGGEIAMSVEAEITEQNCNQSISAQTLEIRDAAGLRVRDLTLEMPGCDTTGDFLVLKNLVEDLTIAAR